MIFNLINIISTQFTEPDGYFAGIRQGHKDNIKNVQGALF